MTYDMGVSQGYYCVFSVPFWGHSTTTTDGCTVCKVHEGACSRNQVRAEIRINSLSPLGRREPQGK